MYVYLFKDGNHAVIKDPHKKERKMVQDIFNEKYRKYKCIIEE